jgi:TonB family protein
LGESSLKPTAKPAVQEKNRDEESRPPNSSAAKPQPSTAIVIEFAPVPIAPSLPSVLPVPPAVVAWKTQIVALLERHKRYPEEAAAKREGGVAQVFFSLDRQGRVLESRIVRSSGSSILDEEALAVLRRAEPFPPPPEVLGGDHVDLTVPYRFNLTQPATPASTGDLKPQFDKPLFLSLKSDLSLFLGNDPVARDALGSVFDAATGGNKDAPIYLRADRTVPYGELMRIMELLRTAGYVKISLVGLEKQAPQPSAASAPSHSGPPRD